MTTPLGVLHRAVHEVTGAADDYDQIIDAARDAHFVLIGEASHGTHEFYAERATITRRLIQEQGFHAVAVEADWPDAYRVNEYVRGIGTDATPDAALGGFIRFPTWMWRNRVVEEFVSWLREHNDGRPPAGQAGFYGLDLYSLYTSLGEVLRYLDEVDPAEAQRARQRYACFELFGEDAQAYGYAAVRQTNASCEDEAVEQLMTLRRKAQHYASMDGQVAADAFFYAEQNARLVRNAEEYYRAMYRGRVSSWNLRDQHMCETLYALRDHFRAQGIAAPRIVVWAHNSHLGDARATQMGQWGEWNLGQLVRQRSGRDAILIGFTTYTGTVTAASDWDEPAELKYVRPGLPGSYEGLLHELEFPALLVPLHRPEAAGALRHSLLERAIGVIYRPETERASHYFEARLTDQFDFVIHVDETGALEPLEHGALWSQVEPPETYPSGI